MRIDYAPRATRDLQQIGAYYRSVADEKIAAAVGRRIEHVINLIARQPRMAPRVSSRAEVRVVLVLRYPYKIFYRVRGDVIEILHIRHTARRPWIGEAD